MCAAARCLTRRRAPQGTANMFSCLRMHGGSSHWFLPTNLLQTAFGNASAYPPDATLMGEVFGGGIVRYVYRKKTKDTPRRLTIG